MTKSLTRILLLKEQTSTQDPYQIAFDSQSIKSSFLPVLCTRLISKLEVQKVLEQHHGFTGLIITSKRALEAIESNVLTPLEQCPNLLQYWIEKPIWVVGKGTATAAISLGFQYIKGQESGNASNLSQLIIHEHAETKERWLYLTGDKNRPTLRDELVRAGILFTEYSVYETVGASNFQEKLSNFLQETNAGLLWIVVFSPSGFDIALPILSTLIPKHVSAPSTSLEKRIMIASIGPTTTLHITSLGYKVSAEADKPEPSSLLKAILEGV